MKNLLPLLTAALLVAAVTTPAAAQESFVLYDKTEFEAAVGGFDSGLFTVDTNQILLEGYPSFSISGDTEVFSLQVVTGDPYSQLAVFAPTSPGTFGATLTITYYYWDFSDDPFQPPPLAPTEKIESFTLTGTTIINGTDPQADPQELIAELIDFYNAALALETIKGVGPGRSGANRVRAVGNMLRSAQKLIGDGYYDLAIEQLEDILKRATGSNHPSNFVAGTGLAEFQFRLLELIEALGG
jgi:hypothetical protein